MACLGQGGRGRWGWCTDALKKNWHGTTFCHKSVHNGAFLLEKWQTLSLFWVDFLAKIFWNHGCILVDLWQIMPIWIIWSFEKSDKIYHFFESHLWNWFWFKKTFLWLVWELNRRYLDLTDFKPNLSYPNLYLSERDLINYTTETTARRAMWK